MFRAFFGVLGQVGKLWRFVAQRNLGQKFSPLSAKNSRSEEFAKAPDFAADLKGVQRRGFGRFGLWLKVCWVMLL